MCSFATSTFAQKTAADEISITKELDEAYVAVTDNGGTATLSFVVEGSGNVSYQWYKSIDGTTESGTAIAGAMGSSYTTEVFKAANTSQFYYCVATVGENSVNSRVAMVANTGLPTLYVNTPTDDITSKDDWTDGTLLTMKDAGIYNFENLKTEFRGRGNSTWEKDKKPYAIKIKKKSCLCLLMKVR